MDFRNTTYNYLSTLGLSVNVRMEEALYSLHDGKLLVNGTYMTEVHITALVFGETTCRNGCTPGARVSYFTPPGTQRYRPGGPGRRGLGYLYL